MIRLPLRCADAPKRRVLDLRGRSPRRLTAPHSGRDALLAAMGLGVAGLVLGVAAGAGAATVGVIDTFQTGATQDWIEAVGGFGIPPVPPAAIANAGPDGAGDFALRITATGAPTGAGSKLVVNNIQPRWTGSYTAAGLNGIILDARNPSAVDLTVRVAIDGPPIGATGGRWVTDGVRLPAGSGWRTLVFALRPQDLLPADLTATSVATTLGNVAVLRILHSPTAAWSGVSVAAQLDLDNIEALPEPTLGVAAFAGLAWLRALASRRRR